ncbi:cobalt-zinc-cadmium efflux system membrane fusion protein [Pedobacter sp. UYP30]|uniref:efflux RND transporter periplasmic adaptor subunit n=1 Tax=Pedobacter sp. UYP30 TaxID=1756400 RepID=UPI003397D172
MKIIYTILITCLFCVGLAACDSKKTAHKEESAEVESPNEVQLTPEQYKTAGISLGKISLKVLSGTIKVNGSLDLPPQSKVSISTPFAGMLKSTSMLQGKKVRKGEAIAVLEHPDYIQIQQEYLEGKTQLNYLKTEYDRQQELAVENVNAKKTLQKAKSDYETALSKISGQKQRLKLMNINPASLNNGNLRSTITLYSPISGYVTEVHSNIGSMASPSDVLFEIADTEHLHAELTVFEKDIPKLKVGQKVRFTLANESKERMATVYLIGREISAERTVNIHCHLDQEDNQLLPGMYLQALVESSGKKVAALPTDAIVRYEGEHYIFIKESKQDTAQMQSHFKMMKITTGITELGFTEINFPENTSWESMDVVLKGAYDLLSKMKNSEEGGDDH